MNFTLRQLGYFKALTVHRNFGRAAAACNVSQPALSVQIRALEQELGGALVERQARDVLLTPLGREVLHHAEQMLKTAARLDTMARDRSGGRGPLALGLIPTLAPYLLAGVLGTLRAGDLSLNVQVREARTDPLLASLRAGDLDAAVVALPCETDGLHVRALFADRFLLAGSQPRLDRLQDSLSARIRPADLEPSQLLLLEDGHCLTDQALEVCGHSQTRAGINTGASSLATLSRLVAAGFGLTLMPEIAAEAEMRAAPGMRLRRFPAPEPARTIALVRRNTTRDAAWFDRLGDLVSEVGQGIIATLQTQSGPADGRPAA